jgi:hypothetical protein
LHLKTTKSNLRVNPGMARVRLLPGSEKSDECATGCRPKSLDLGQGGCSSFGAPFSQRVIFRKRTSIESSHPLTK